MPKKEKKAPKYEGMSEKDPPILSDTESEEASEEEEEIEIIREEPKQEEPKQEDKDEQWRLEANAKIEQRKQTYNRRLEELHRNADETGGYSAHERPLITSKQELRDLCQEFAVYLGADPKMRRFIREIISKYTDIDMTRPERYNEEVAFIKSLPSRIAAMEESLKEQEEKLRSDVRDFYGEVFPKEEELTEEQKKKDKEFAFCQEVIDNKRRILASVGVYFDTVTDGSLEMPDLKDKANQDELERANNSGYCSVTLKDKEGNEFRYLNAAGQSAKKSDFLTTGDHMKPDAPIFTHEPSMNDVKQGMSGECYLYAALQDMARLYPEKIREMIKDNGDGTATVRLFERERKDGETTFKPVFVRVDKATPSILGMDRGGQDCMWVNVIERAYMMSGLHLQYDKDSTRMVDTAEMKTTYDRIKRGDKPSVYDREHFPWIFDQKGHLKEWTPNVASIEGGEESETMELLMGPDFVKTKIAMPDRATLDAPESAVSPEKEAEAKKDAKEREITNFKDPEQALRFGLRKLFAPDDYQAYLKKDRTELIRDSYTRISGVRDLMTEQEYVERMTNLYDYTMMNFQPLYRGQGCKVNEKIHESMIRIFTEHFITKPDETVPKDMQMSVVSSLMLTGIKDRIRSAFLDPPPAMTPNRLFEEVSEKLQKGFPVSAGTLHGKEISKEIASGHAYSVIGAFRSDENPPRSYFRLRNPWGDRRVGGALGDLLGVTDNGIRYQEGKNGARTTKWVKVEEGIFDIEVKDYCRLFHRTDYNGSRNLANTPHLKTEGYEIITAQDAREHEEQHVTPPMFTEYARCANDVYDAMLSTNSYWSNDSPQYKALTEQVKVFMENVSKSRGKSREELVTMSAPLKDAAQAYLEHVPAKASSRQEARSGICMTILALTEALEKKSEHPAKVMEEKLAQKMLEKHFAKEKKPVPENLPELVGKMCGNRAFRTVANRTNICDMFARPEHTAQKCLREFEKLARGRGVDKGLDLDTLQTSDFIKSL